MVWKIRDSSWFVCIVDKQVELNAYAVFLEEALGIIEQSKHPAYLFF
jgi:hypothetical protein